MNFFSLVDELLFFGGRIFILWWKDFYSLVEGVLFFGGWGFYRGSVFY